MEMNKEQYIEANTFDNEPFCKILNTLCDHFIDKPE